MKEGKILIRTDRNGTKYWEVTEACPRCGGRGDYILGTTNYGVCFQCGGNGWHQYTWKEYTPEHEAKLEAKRKAKAEKRLAEKAKYEEEHAEEIAAKRAEEDRMTFEFRCADHGCGKDGIGYVLTGKTYAVRDQIKKAGGKWIYGVWICPVAIEGKGITVKKIDISSHISTGMQTWKDDFDLYEEIYG